MASRSLAIDSLVKNLKDTGPFKKEVILNFYEKRGESLSDNLLAVRINRLKKMGVLSSVAKGLFEISRKRPFYPEFSFHIDELHKRLKDQYPIADIAIWETAWLNEFATLQVINNWTIIEVESNAEEAIFETVHNMEPNRTFLDPGEKELELYLLKKENPFIIKTLLTGSPKTKVDEVVIPKLEKILVDLYFDKFLDKIFQTERANILNEAFKRYSINYTTLLSYAARRGKKKEMTDIVKKNVQGLSAFLINLYGS